MLVLMLEDTEVLKFDLDKVELEVINPNLLPISLRDSISINDNLALLSSFTMLIEWLARRLLPLTRTNAKALYTLIQCPQAGSMLEKAKLTTKYNSVSVNDCYWVKEETLDKKWVDIDIRRKHLADLVEVSLEGKAPSLTVDERHPDFYTDGLFPKTWVRRGNKLCLLKGDKSNDNINVKSEVWTSKILDCFKGIYHIEYVEEEIDGLTVSSCELLNRPDGVSICSCSELYDFCMRHKMDYKVMCVELFGADFANMCIVDYLVHNTDRHIGNYYFYMENSTGTILGLTPLLDHNQALISYLVGRVYKDVLTQVYNNKETMEGVARDLVAFSDLQIDYEKLDSLRSEIPEVIIDGVMESAKELFGVG